MKQIFTLSLAILCYFTISVSVAQSPVQNIDPDDRITIKNLVDSLLLYNCIDSIAAKKAQKFIDNRMNEGYYDNYTENNLNYLLQISHDIQTVLEDKNFDVFLASPRQTNHRLGHQNMVAYGWRWWKKTDYGDLNIDSLRKIGLAPRISMRADRRAYQGKGWLGKVLFYRDFGATIEYKIGYHAMGVPEMKILEGNIGYIKIKHWIDNKKMNIPMWAMAAHYLYNTEALVIDLRDSGKGDITAMFDFLRYFLPPSKEYLGSTYNKPTKTKQDFFNSKKHKLKPHKVSKRNRRNFETYMHRPLIDFSQLKGKNLRLLKQNIYILTDEKTISISEYFALLLRKHRKAILVGENTGGYGYVTHQHQIWLGSLHVYVPETKILAMDSIHRKGLAVDWKTDEPLETTWTKLVQQLADTTELVYTQTYLDGLLAYRKAQKNKLQLSQNQLDSLTGDYKLSKKIIAEKGILYLEEFGERKKLTAVDSNLFIVDSFYENNRDIHYFSFVSHYSNTKLEPVYVRFDKNDAGKPALYLIYFGGDMGEFEKL
jgi:hypothetical protein